MTATAVIFDFDGTITRPNLDFDAIRAEIGIASGPILEHVARMTPDEAHRAQEILERHEWEAAHAAELQEEAAETIESLRARGLKIAVLTRNARPILDHVLAAHDMKFDAIRTREDGAIKPLPDGVLALCKQLDADPKESWMIGDYLFDIQAGHAAGATTVLMLGDREPPDYADQADHIIRRLPDLISLIR